jgi:hypothetical protein
MDRERHEVALLARLVEGPADLRKPLDLLGRQVASASSTSSGTRAVARSRR